MSKDKAKIMVIGCANSLSQTDLLAAYEKVDRFAYSGTIMGTEWRFHSGNTAKVSAC